jgi:alpha-tubulin suppressor-like RCC1 family protein
MTFGVNNLINCVNQSATRTDLTSLELLQLTGSSCGISLPASIVFSVACQASLPTASDNTGRFVYITNECKYLFSNGAAWIDDFKGLNSSAWGWGRNNEGQIGDNTAATKSSPVSVVGGFTDWCQISAGNQFSLGLRTNGTARAWGDNGQGRLGDNTIVNKSSPVSVVGGFTDWCQISAGSLHSLAVRTNGTAWAWGRGTCGMLGDGTTVNKSSPVSVIGILDWCQISGGEEFSLAIRQNGTAWAWGLNSQGRLGDNTIVNKSSPVSVVSGFTDWCQISAGKSHSLAIRQNGTAWAWGEGSSGRLGDNTINDKSSPVSVVGGFTDWCQVSAGSCHSLGVRTNGTAWAWGDNGEGRLGDNTTVSKRSPISVIGGFTDWCQISAGESHSLAVRQSGTAWAWGLDLNGRLGDGNTVDQSSPVSVVGGYTDWWYISAGCAHSLAIRKSCGF